jgi:hypothetical protein
MTDEREVTADGWLEEVIDCLREPVERTPGSVDAVVRAALMRSAPAGDDAPGRGTPVAAADRGLWRWFTRPRLTLSPLSAAAWAAAVAVVALLVGVPFGGHTDDRASTPVRHQFVLVAPDARSVSLVGDFNGWDSGATPLVRQGEAWTVELDLEPGRHVYSFVVDGDEWVPDRSAPRAPEDDFGRPSSVILVGRDT